MSLSPSSCCGPPVDSQPPVHPPLKRSAISAAAFDPFYPFRGGGEAGLFLPSAWYGVDFEGIAGAVAEHGSFYPSMHFSWHFDEVNHELTRPVGADSEPFSSGGR